MSRNLIALLFENSQSMGRQTALLEFDSGVELSWSEIWSLSLSVSKRIQTASSGYKYIICITRDPTLSCLFLFGSWLAARTPILVNPNYTGNEFWNVDKSLRDQKIEVYSWLCDETTFEKVDAAFPARCAEIIKIDRGIFKTKPIETDSTALRGLGKMEDVDALGLLTSGSTHLPKLVQFSHHNLLRSAEIEIDNDSLLKQTNIVNLRPHFTSGGCNTLWPWIQSGGQMTFSSATAQLPNVRNVRNVLLHTKPDLLICSPSMLNILAESKDGQSVSAGPVPTYFGGMSISEHVLKSLISMGLHPWMRYGMTEIGHIVSKVDLSHGPPYPAKGDVGHAYRGISVSSDSNSLVFRGDGIARSCVNGTLEFVSDDLGEVRGNRINLRGRENRIANVNGFRFPVAEVQIALESRNDLQHVLVLAVPNGFNGDEVVAFFKPRNLNDADEHALRLFLQDLLVNFKRPSRYIFVQEWPLTANGKANQAALLNLLK